METDTNIKIGLADHMQRVRYLISKLAAQHVQPDLLESFDKAVEFAALEGTSIAEGISEFFRDFPEFVVPGRALGIAAKQIELRELKLPVIPKHAGWLLRTPSDAISAAELERITSADPVHAGKLLGAANSARFGSRFEIVSLRDAIMRLGIPESRNIVLASCFGGLFASKPLRDIWTHSEAVAGISRRLAEASDLDPDSAFVAGLLHDVGRLAFTRVPAELKIRERLWLEAGFPIVYAETLAFGQDHASLGAQCLQEWEIPGPISEAVLFHHRPECSASPLASLLCLAEDVACREASTTSEDLWPDIRRMTACLNTGIELSQVYPPDTAQSSGTAICA